MILLNGHSLSPVKRIPLENMSLQLKERDSTATITPSDMTGITVNSWMQDDTEPGKGIVWRVKSISEAYATRTPTVQLEHAINSLKDIIMFGEHKPKDITGNNSATTCTAEQTIRYILGKQSDWVLWRFDYAGTSNPYQFDGDTLFDALETVTSSLKNAWWTYDMNVYPFRLNIIRQDNTVYSELRPGRNLRTITKTIDKSGMYTRFYPIGKDDLHLSDYAVDRNTQYYGVVSKVETDASIDSEAELRRWANERLDDHAEPTVTIDVEAFDLADSTGESLDRMWLGFGCRIPLAEFGTTINERIVGITFQDKINQPDVIKVTLSNNRTDLTKIIAESMKSGGKSRRTSTKQDKEDHAWFEDTGDHVAMCAIGIIGTDAQGNPNWTRLSRLEVNENGIYGEVKSVQGELVIAETAIKMNEEAITLEAKRAQTEEGRLTGELTVQADRITAEVTRAKDSELQLQGKLLVTADSVSMVVNQGSDTREIKYYEKYSDFPLPGSNLYRYYDMQFHRYYEWRNGGYVRIGDSRTIKAADICTAINEDGDPIAVINAAKIYLLGQTIANTITANYIDSKISTLATLHAKDITANSITANVNLYLPNGLSVYSQGIWQLSLTQDGNTYTLKELKLNGDEREVGSFSRATSLSGEWSGRNYTVTASPQGETKTGIVYDGLVNTGNVTRSNKFVYQDVIVYSDDGEGNADKIIMTKSVGINASSVWDAGQSAKYVDALRITGYGSRSWSSGVLYQNIGIAADYNTGGSYVTAISADVTAAYNDGVASVSPTALGIYDTNSTKRTGTINLGWNGSIDLWGGYTTDGGTTWVWGDQLTVHGKALPTIDNVDRKSSGISGTNAGDVSGKSGTYVTFDMAGSSYYIKIG